MTEQRFDPEDERTCASYLLQLRDELDRLQGRPWDILPVVFSIMGGTPFLAAFLITRAPLAALLTVGAFVILPTAFTLRFVRLRRKARESILRRIDHIERRRRTIETARG